MVVQDWIPEKIKNIRKEKRIKQETVAKYIGISQPDYSLLENGKLNNYVNYLPKIAECLGVNYHQLVSQNNVSQTNYGEIASHGFGNAAHVYTNDNKELYELLINELQDEKELIKSLFKEEKNTNQILREKIIAYKMKVKELEDFIIKLQDMSKL